MVLVEDIEHRMRNLLMPLEGRAKKGVHLFAPPVPKHVSQIEKFLSDEIFQMRWRSKVPGWSEQPLLEDLSQEQPTAVSMKRCT